jgi:hypothetical protein
LKSKKNKRTWWIVWNNSLEEEVEK